jgi:hypothetical protein
LGEKLVYEPEVFLGYQMILKLKRIQTLEGKINKKKGFCECGRWRCES